MNNHHGNNRETLKEIKEREAKFQEHQLREKCEDLATQRYGKELEVWNKQFRGIWFLPVIDAQGEIAKLAVMRPIDRHILSHATTKIESDGLYVFLEACMRECLIAGDPEILDDDEYFIPASMKFNKMLEGHNVAFLKR